MKDVEDNAFRKVEVRLDAKSAKVGPTLSKPTVLTWYFSKLEDQILYHVILKDAFDKKKSYHVRQGIFLVICLFIKIKTAVLYKLFQYNTRCNYLRFFLSFWMKQFEYVVCSHNYIFFFIYNKVYYISIRLFRKILYGKKCNWIN